MLITPFKAEKSRKINEGLALDVEIGTHVENPTISIIYSNISILCWRIIDVEDGKSAKINGSKMEYTELESVIFRHANFLQNKENAQ